MDVERFVTHLSTPQDDAIFDVVATALDNFEQFHVDVAVRSPHALKCRTAGLVPRPAGTNWRVDKAKRYGNGVECIPIETFRRIGLGAEHVLWRLARAAARNVKDQNPSRGCDHAAAGVPADNLESGCRCSDACGFLGLCLKTQTSARCARADNSAV